MLYFERRGSNRRLELDNTEKLLVASPRGASCCTKKPRESVAASSDSSETSNLHFHDASSSTRLIVSSRLAGGYVSRRPLVGMYRVSVLDAPQLVCNPRVARVRARGTFVYV